MSKQSFLYPQEIEVFYIIPALKRELALALKESGLKQCEVAQLLQIEDATVSQYINNKRGVQISFPPTFKEEVKKATSLISDKISLVRETQRLLRLARTSGVLCQVHKDLSPIPDECHTSLTGCFSMEVKV